MFCSFLCYNAQNDIQILLRIDKFFRLPKHWLLLSSLITEKKKSFVCTYLSCTSLLSFMELFSKITFFSCIPAKLVVVSFPKASAKLQGLFQTTKFFGRKFSENFSVRSAKTSYAPYSQRVKAHKKILARRALFVPPKAQGPLPCRDANANLDLS